MSKKLLMIVNPAAGKGKGRMYEQRVSALYTQAGWDCDIRNTQGAGDAARFALPRRAAQADMLLCIGGDGTLSETLGGLTQLSAPPPLCYVPMGSTNDLALSAGLPRNAWHAAQCGLTGVRSHRRGPLQRPGVFVCGVLRRVFAHQLHHRSQDEKPPGAFCLYSHRRAGAEPHPSLSGADRRRRHLHHRQLSLWRGVQYPLAGGALRLPVDESALHDGRHELLLVREPKHIYQAVSLLLCLARGKYDHPLIVCQSVSRAVFHMPEDMPWSLDGERADAGRTVVFENMPSAIA